MPVLASLLLSNWKFILIGIMGVALWVLFDQWQAERDDNALLRKVSEQNYNSWQAEKAQAESNLRIVKKERDNALKIQRDLTKDKADILEIIRTSPAACPPSPALRAAIGKLRDNSAASRPHGGNTPAGPAGASARTLSTP